ncbi:MAG: hypothetical protein LBK76_08390 [Verrucomicrobiales bacterium]|jgi:hypothetical protein|nr:hypothetical protein [Verrucomicrobiales bacterium]
MTNQNPSPAPAAAGNLLYLKLIAGALLALGALLLLAGGGAAWWWWHHQRDNTPLTVTAPAQSGPPLTVSISEGDNPRLTLQRGGERVATYAAGGWLLNQQPSPGQRFVAASERRGNAGDYLWILSADGAVLKRAGDALGEQIMREAAPLADAAARKFSADYQERRSYLSLGAWRDADTLTVNFERAYHSPSAAGILLKVEALARVTDSGVTIEGYVPCAAPQAELSFSAADRAASADTSPSAAGSAPGATYTSTVIYETAPVVVTSWWVRLNPFRRHHAPPRPPHHAPIHHAPPPSHHAAPAPRRAAPSAASRPAPRQEFSRPAPSASQKRPQQASRPAPSAPSRRQERPQQTSRPAPAPRPAPQQFSRPAPSAPPQRQERPQPFSRPAPASRPAPSAAPSRPAPRQSSRPAPAKSKKDDRQPKR